MVVYLMPYYHFLDLNSSQDLSFCCQSAIQSYKNCLELPQSI
uniref:Uncharacterized protein MANES_11G161400 n=2 Tax=Rhizophora mucronata TaxID=61149 RepID=A0A2P2J8J8_RHIMU